MRKFSKQLECEEIQKKDAFLFATFSSYASGSLRLRRLLKARSRSTNATTLSGEPPRIGTLIAAHPARALLTMQWTTCREWGDISCLCVGLQQTSHTLCLVDGIWCWLLQAARSLSPSAPSSTPRSLLLLPTPSSLRWACRRRQVAP